jgi:hypothetical protein
MGWKCINGIIEVGTFWTRSQDAVTSFVDHGYQHRLHQSALQQLQDYSLSFIEGELYEERHAKCLFDHV